MNTGQVIRMRFLWLLVLCTCAVAQHNPNRDFRTGDRRYFLVDEPATWNDTLHICRASGAHLAVITSLEEAEDVIRIMTMYDIEYIHLGFHDSFTEGDYVTVSGETLLNFKEELSPLHLAYPRRDAEKGCGGFSLKGFSSIKCSEQRPFICSFNKRTAAAYPTLPGYFYEELIPGYYKLYNDTDMSWVAAERTCRNDGAQLLVINSQREIDILRTFNNYIPPSQSWETWTGIHRFFGGDDDYISVFGETLNETGYATWGYPGQPADNYTNQPFVFYTWSSTSEYQGLITAGSFNRKFFFCEQELS